MKRYTILLITITICSFVTQCVYATSSENIIENVTENSTETLESETYETGQAVITFVGNYGSDNIINSNSIYVEGVTIELYYRKDGVMQNVTTLPDFPSYTLVSDVNGQIVLQSLPYGMYQYEIISVPMGLIINNNSIKFEVVPSDWYVNDYNFLTIEQKIADNVIEDNEVGEDEDNIQDSAEGNIEENVTNDTVEQPDVIEQETQNDVVINQTAIQSVETEQPLENKQDTSVLDRFYNTDRTNFENKTEDNVINSSVTETMPKKLVMSKKDAIEALREYRITDSIRVAIIDYDPSVHRINQLAKLPDDDRKKKKINVLNPLNEKIFQKNELIYINNDIIRSTRINILNKVA